jgi:hypothetical protein
MSQLATLYRIQDLPAGERPRERLTATGPQALSTAELIAVLLRTGGRGHGALQTAQTLLQQTGGLHGLRKASISDLCAIPFVGPSKAALILAAVELGRRLAVSDAEEAPTVSSPAAAAGLVQYEMSGLERTGGVADDSAGFAQPADSDPRGLSRFADHFPDPHRRSISRGDQGQRGRDDRRAQPSQRRSLAQSGGSVRHAQPRRSRPAPGHPGA